MGGPMIFIDEVKEMLGYDKTDIEKSIALAKEVDKQYWAFIFLERADKSKYNFLLNKNLHQQHTLLKQSVSENGH
jgi:hypothetical protein